MKTLLPILRRRSDWTKILILIVAINFPGCATLNEAYNPKSLNQRITASQNRWRTTASGFHVPGARPAYSSPSPELQAILNKLLYVSPLRGFPVKAYVVEDNQLNAVADGNSIYFHRPLLNLLKNDSDRIAGVMAHELGHIIGNHIKGKVTRMVVQEISTSLSQLSENQDVNAMVDQIFTLSSLAYERREEKEADVMGAVLAFRAGYDPAGLAEALSLMNEQRQSDAMQAIALLVPYVTAYNEAVSNYNSNVARYNLYGNQQAYLNAVYWAEVARLQAIKIQSVVSAIKQGFDMVNPIYLSHPPDEQRIHAVNLVRMKELNNMGPNWLAQQDSHVSNVYQILTSRSPKK